SELSRPSTAKKMGATALTHLLHRLQELLQRRFPEFRQAGGAMAARVLARRDQVDTAVLDALDLTFQEPSFGGIALVVRRVDGEQWRHDAVELRCWIVVARGLPLIEQVVRIGCGPCSQPVVEELVGAFARWRELLVGKRAAAGRNREEHGGRL